jgi:S-(hydroxymethyl)glutathione dehydrogenase/alcohol dehydrogenase
MAASGTFSEETVVPAIGAVKISDDIPLTVAALIGCGVLTGFGAAVNTADIRPGDTVAVVGCGGVGLNVIQGARHMGAERIIAVDMNEGKLQTAQKFGATDLVNASDGDPVAAVKRSSSACRRSTPCSTSTLRSGSSSWRSRSAGVGTARRTSSATSRH